MIGGIILAAGESRRMGKPKALLEFSDRKTLLTKQVRLLHDAGCDPVVVVVGFDADAIIRAHPHLEVSWCVNKNWETGQFSSIQSGILHILNLNPPTPPFSKGGSKLLPPFEKGGTGGILILPIDVVGVATSTVKILIEAAVKKPDFCAIVPAFRNRGGHPVFVSRAFCQKIVDMDPAQEDARMDALLRQTPDAVHLPVDDMAVIRNINTPDEWEKNCRNASSL